MPLVYYNLKQQKVKGHVDRKREGREGDEEEQAIGEKGMGKEKRQGMSGL